MVAGAPPPSLPMASGRAEALGALHEVQHVAAQAAPEAIPPLRIAINREAALGLLVEGADALADPAPSSELHARRLHHFSQRMEALERLQVNLSGCYDHDFPPSRDRSPRRLLAETIFPGCQRRPSTARTSTVPISWGASAAARPVPWL